MFVVKLKNKIRYKLPKDFKTKKEWLIYKKKLRRKLVQNILFKKTM